MEILAAFFRFSFSPTVLSLLLAALIALVVALNAWGKREQYASAATLALLMLNVAAWLLAYSLEILSTERLAMAFWLTIATICQAFVGPFWLILAAQYSNLARWFNTQRLLWVLSPGIVTLILAITNPWHHLLWSGIAISTARNLSVAIPLAGPWYWALAIYRYLYLLVGSSLIFVPLVRSPASYSKQGLLIAVGGLLPLVGNALHIFTLTQAVLLDIGPFAFVISGLALSLGFFTYRLLDVLPLAQRVIFESMPEGVIVLDHQGNLIDVNPAARQMLGVSGGTTRIYTRLDQVISPEDQQKIWGALENKEEFSTGVGPSVRWLRPSLTPITDHQGQSRGQLLLLYDITEAHNVAQLREDLVHMMVHDLRNPLTIAQGSLELLADETFASLDANATQLVQMIQNSTQQCLDIVKKILDLQQLESGAMALELRPIPLAGFLEQLAQQMAPLASMKRQNLVAQIPEGLPPAHMDHPLIERVLQNLIGNAIKFTPEGGTITIRASQGPEQLQIDVADTGPGVPPSIQERLFTKFVTGAHRNKGSGLGLAFCKLAIEAHSGRIWFHSQEGQGSTFSFTLPIYADATFEDEASADQAGSFGQNLC